MKVLIVDDRPDNRLLLQEQLRVLSAEPVAAESGVRALRELRTQSFDLVISDLLMPEMDGFQLCYLLKTDPKLRKTPVIIYTANYATKRDEQQAKDLGADDFITRPIDDDELTSRIRGVLERSQRGQVAQPRAKPEEGFFREYSSLLVEKLEDQLITAEENSRLHAKNTALQRQLEAANQELKAANEELLIANEDLEAFSYSVSHDLRAPVRALEGMLNLLLEELGPLEGEAQLYVSRIQFNIHRMNALITGLLAHSRMRKVDGAGPAVDLEAVVRSAVTGLDFAIKESRAEVRVQSPLPPVRGYEQALGQIITNLIDNGLKFIAPGTAPRIEVSAERRGERVRVRITDNGIGIPPEHQQRLFHVFERLHPGSQYPGTGLGLAIVKRGIEKMGGKVGVESTPGHGSTFWLELEAAPEKTHG
jgi:signal transduction histidine kinase